MLVSSWPTHSLADRFRLLYVRWRQVVLALGAALVVGWAAPRVAGADLELAVAAGIVAYVVVRVGLATLGRTRHYVRSGASPGRGRTTCGSCGNRIWRLSGDWILTCKRCGWRPGVPGLRWVTRSVPSRQLLRSVEWQRVVLLGVAGLVILAGFPSQVPGGLGVTGADAPAPVERSVSQTSPDPPPEQTAATVADRAESMTIDKINRFRETNGLAPLEESSELNRLAQEHSTSMAEESFYDHDEPGGPTFDERISRVCASGSENIHRGPMAADVRIYDGSTTVNTRTPSGMSEYLVRGWRNSEGHRENLLGSFSRVGVGISLTDGEFYATANFC